MTSIFPLKIPTNYYFYTIRIKQKITAGEKNKTLTTPDEFVLHFQV